MTKTSMRALLTTVVYASVVVAPLRVQALEVPLRTSVEVDTSQVGEAGPVIQRRIRERSDVVLRQQGVLPARGTQDPIVLVTVFELGGEDPGYAFDLRAARAGQDVLHTERFQCRLCTETELVSEVETRLSSVVTELGARIEAEQVATPEPTPEDRPFDGAARDEGQGLGTMGKAGVATLVTGTVGLAVGIGLAARRDRPKTFATELTTTKPPGYALIAVGAAVALTGGVLLALDRRKVKRRTAWTPWFGPTALGLAAAGRF